MRSGQFAVPRASRKTVSSPPGRAGFTLLELMIVIMIILILAGMAAVRYEKSVLRAREATLKTGPVYDAAGHPAYTLDKQVAPSSLDDLVQAKYIVRDSDRPDYARLRIGTWILKMYCCLRSKLRLA